MSDGIRRSANRTSGFTIMVNEVFQRKDISARAKGIFAYLMTLPNDWVIHKAELFTHFTEGREALDKAFNELMDAGYVTREVKKEGGRFVAFVYTVFESTTNGIPVTGKPLPVFPVSENPVLLSTDLELSTKKQKEPKHKHGEYSHVLLTSSELDKLKTAFPLDFEQRIKNLDEGIELKGYSYKSHYLAILKWAEKERGNTTPLFATTPSTTMSDRDARMLALANRK